MWYPEEINEARIREWETKKAGTSKETWATAEVMERALGLGSVREQTHGTLDPGSGAPLDSAGTVVSGAHP